MIRRSLLIASVVAAMSFAGSAAQAAFTVTATTIFTDTDTSGITFTSNNFAGPTPTPFALSYNFLNVNYSGVTPNPATTGTLTAMTTFLINNNGVLGSTTTTDTFSYVFSGGVGMMTATSLPTIGAVDGLTFTATQFAAASLITGSASSGNLSTTVSAVAPASVPEPASLAMLGLGLVGVGFVAKRRRAV